MTHIALPQELPACPIDTLLTHVLTSLHTTPRLVLSAPPGAGKSTRIPLALLSAAWLDGKKILMLEPRRLAAKATARYMAHLLGERVGKRIGYTMRLEHCTSQETRIEVVTEGILTRILQTNPELTGIGCIIFDEFHERSLHADLGLALCLECQEAFRPDLRLLVMSATIESKNLIALLDNCPFLSSEGKAYPVNIRYAPPGQTRIEEHMAKAIRHSLQTEQGSILAFLPGTGEIQRVLTLLEAAPLPNNVCVFPLHGTLPPAEQDAAIAPIIAPTRKVVLATALAETSLTIEGVRIVIDSGLARHVRYDTGTGLNRLITTRVTLAQAKQRAGRAGRTEPGLCIRLWSQDEEINFSAFVRPEISEADLSPLLLHLAAWGATDPLSLRWLTPPPQSALRLATEVLRSLHAIDTKGILTSTGKAMLHLPVHPRLAHMLITAPAQYTEKACTLAALLEERDLLPHADSDIRRRIQVFENKNNPTITRLRQNAKQLHNILTHKVQNSTTHNTVQADVCLQKLPDDTIGALVALAWPEWVAQRCGENQYRLRCGRLAHLPKEDTLARTPFIAIAAINGDPNRCRIFLAAPISQQCIEKLFMAEIKAQASVTWDARNNMVQARQQRCLGALILHDIPLSEAATEAKRAAMLEGIKCLGIAALPWTEELRQWQARIQLMHSLDAQLWPDVSDTALLNTTETWLAPFLDNISKASQLRNVDLTSALHNLLPWDLARKLKTLAPTHITVPSGSAIKLDYTKGSCPVLAVKLQEVFGWQTSPTIADGRVTLCLHLTSPAGRPLQITQDLQHFWQHGYAAVRAEMRGRYPKHPWPLDPLTAQATRLTNKKLLAEAQKTDPTTKGHKK